MEKYGPGKGVDEMSGTMETEPVFPVVFHWAEGGQNICQSADKLALDLEWFDSDGGGVEVRDNLGRPVRVRVEKFEIVWCELIRG